MDWIDREPETTVGRYRLIRALGRGAQGSVWHARHVDTEREVALKLLAVPATDGRAVAVAAREVKAATSGNHRGIVTVYETGRDRALHWIAMELVGGGSLEDLRRRWSTTARNSAYYFRVAELFEQIASAMSHVHDRGVLHRDLKPSNILIDEHAHPKVADFGLARVEGDTRISRTGDFVGTFAYASPEQVIGSDEIDHRTDVFSLGAILFQFQTGECPFGGDMFQRLRHRISLEPARRPSSLEPTVPRDLERICLKALEKNPPDRYASMSAMAEDLHRFRNHRPIQAQSPTLLKRAALFSRRRQRELTFGCIAFALGTGAVWNWTRAEAHAATVQEIEGAVGPLNQLAPADRDWVAAQVRGQLATRAGLLREAGMGKRSAQVSRVLKTIAPSWPETHLTVARQKLTGGDLAGAEQEYQRVLLESPQDPAALLGLALVAEARGDVPAALDHTRQVIALYPEHSKALTLAGLYSSKLGRMAEGLAYGKRAIALGSDSLELHLMCGAALMQAGDFESALYHVVEALAHDLGDARALHLKGICLRELGRSPEAADALRRCIAIDGAPAQAFSDLAQILDDQGKTLKMLRVLDSGAYLHPTNRSLVDNCALLNNKEGNFEQTLELTSESPLEVAGWEGVAASRIEALLHTRQFTEAARLCDRILERSPDDVFLLTAKAEALRLIGRFEDAIAVLDTLIASDPANPQAWLVRGMTRADPSIGLWDDAAADLEQAASLLEGHDDTRWLEALGFQAGVLIQGERYDEAVETLDRVLSLDGSLFKLEVRRALALELSGRMNDSRKAFASLALKYPDAPEVLAGLERLGSLEESPADSR